MATRDITMEDGPAVERGLDRIISSCGNKVTYSVKARGNGTVTYTLMGSSTEVDRVHEMGSTLRLW